VVSNSQAGQRRRKKEGNYKSANSLKLQGESNGLVN